MGVRGLSSFIDCNPNLTEKYKLHDCGVIIDGNNLIHFLYFSHKLDCIFGGDYNRFAEIVKAQFHTYLECNIKPIVIFDGGYDPSDRKLATVFERTKQRLTNVQHIAKYGSCSQKVLPILATEVTISVLKDMNIMYAQCEYEADEQLVILANLFNYPVISQDSDFYIFNINRGFIRLGLINTDASKIEGTDKKYLECQIYQIDRFLSFFTKMDKNVLPLFSTLMGNDISHISAFDEFFANIQLPKFKGKLKVSQRHKKMVGLLTWLQNRTVEDATEQVLSRLKLKKRERIRKVIDLAISSYNTNSSVILDECGNINYNILHSDVKTYHGKSLPLWFLRDIRPRNISPFMLNALCLHRIFLPSQVEDMTLESSFRCSRPIRQIIYGILLSHESDVDDFQNYVEEYDRRSGNIQKIQVSPVFTIDGYGSLPTLQNLNLLDLQSRRLLMSKVIGDDIDYFAIIPDNFQLLFGCVRHWLRNCEPKPTIEVLNAFLLTNIYFSYCVVPFNKENSETVIDDINLNSLTMDEISFFRNHMKKYLQKPQYNNANPILFKIIHYFSQLQACVLYFTYLNKFMYEPFKCLKISDSFNGMNYYNICKDLLKRSSSELFIAELLGRNSNLLKLFIKIKVLVMKDLPESCLLNRNPIRKTELTKVCQSTKKKSKKHQLPEISSATVAVQLMNLSLDVDTDVDVLL